MILHGDCIEVMAGMEPESVDAIVTDPPYGLEFMGKGWDRLWTEGSNGQSGRINGRGGMETWGKRPQYRAGPPMQEWHHRWAVEALRVAKPSAYLLAFGGTRTVHRLASAIEDAGWIIRDTLVWAYASGFPKSKASLKPAWEPIVMARKPGPLRDLAIDLCRIGVDPDEPNHRGDRGLGRSAGGGGMYGHGEVVEYQQHAGRWPSNVILTDPIFDGDVPGVVGGGEQASPAAYVRSVGATNETAYGVGMGTDPAGAVVASYGDSGTYSRFFLIPKADRADREPIMPGMRDNHRMPDAAVAGPVPGTRANVHPTVKPTELMRHLVRLVTPPGGLVLDPFLGSGTTGLAAEMEGFPWVGIEREAEYVAIAEARLNGTQRGLGLEAS